MTTRIAPSIGTPSQTASDPAQDGARPAAGAAVPQRRDPRLAGIQNHGSQTGAASRFGYANKAGESHSASRPASAGPDQDGLQALFDDVREAVKQAASMPNPASALDVATRRVIAWPSTNGQLEALRQGRIAFEDLPKDLRTPELEAAIGKAHDDVINPRMKRLAESIDSLDALKDLLTSFDPSNPNLKTDHLSELARAHFLAAAVGQISTFPPEEWREAHAEISKAIDTLSGPMAEYPGFMLDHAVAHELLAPDVKVAYDRSAQLEQAASSVHDLSGLRARLSEPGIQGPNVPDDTLGFISQDIDGNLGLSMLPRPEPLAVLASRISVFAPDEANAAFCEVFDATDAVQPACRRLPALAALATAAGHLGERDRAVAYERLLSTAHSLRTQNAITSEQLAQLLSEVQDTMAQHAGSAEQSAAAQFKRSVSIVPPGYRAAYDFSYDLTA